MKNYKIRPLLNLITIALILCSSANVQADGFSLQNANTKKLNKEKWDCKYCPTAVTSTKKVTVKLSDNSEENGHFSTITGDNGKGISANVSTDISKREQDEHYQIQANGLGQDNSQVSLLISKIDAYKVALNYQTLNQFGHNKALTPFINSGNSSLQLSDDFIRVTRTSDMPTGAFNTFSNQLEREYWQLELEKQLTNNWQAYVDFQVEDKQGIKTTSGNILTKSVMLPTGVDQQHTQIDLGSYLSTDYGTLLLNYYRSDFNNNRSAVNWNSPYSVLFGGANSGQLSSAPDNQFNQISLFGQYRHEELTLQGRLIYGQINQDQSFLDYTTNPQLDISSPQADDLQGEVKTFSGKIKALYQPSSKLRLTFNYQLDDRDNNTQSNDYQHVLTDSVLINDNKSNAPYSFKKEQLKVEGKYRFAVQSYFDLGWQFDQRERNLQDRKITEDKKTWFKISTHFAAVNKLSIELSRQLRDGSHYQRIDQNSPVDDSLQVQKYNQADREREQVKAQLTFNPFANIQTNSLINTEVDLHGYLSHDKYRKTDIGLIESKNRGYDIAISNQFNKHVSLLVYMHNQWQDNTSQGTYWFKSVDWQALNEDKADTAGINLVAEKLSDGKLTLGADYTYSYAKGTLQIDSLSFTNRDSHTELTVNSQDFKLYADYEYSDSVDLHFDLLYQKFAENDWRFNYDIDAIVNVLGNGLTSYDYDAYRVTSGVTYQF